MSSIDVVCWSRSAVPKSAEDGSTAGSFYFSGCGQVWVAQRVRTLALHQGAELPGGSGVSRLGVQGQTQVRQRLEPQPDLPQSPAMRALGCVLLLCGLLMAATGAASAANPAPNGSSAASRVIEAAGVVEVSLAGSNGWVGATNGQSLLPRDRIRTGERSRAALLFSDQSLLRLNEKTTLEIQAPVGGGRRRFRLPSGSLFFFNRERPADVQFETPIATGAIRGTEFVLEFDETAGRGSLSLLDGRVELLTDQSSLQMQGGERAEIGADHHLSKSPLIETRALIQWALHYPAIVPIAELGLTPQDQETLRPALEAYRQGNLVAAAANSRRPSSPGSTRFEAAVALAVGRIDESERFLATLSSEDAVARALRELIAVTRDALPPEIGTEPPMTAAGWMARSYHHQRRFDLASASEAARSALALAPEFPFASVRLAELLFGQGHQKEALTLVQTALASAPRLAVAHGLEGFVRLEEGDLRGSLHAFQKAIESDAALGSAWLGKGLVEMRLGLRQAALASLQAAAALEPQQATPRAYLGKAFSSDGQRVLAEKEFRLAKALDPQDPTAWLYSALHQWQHHRRNEAVRQLEASVERNGNRSLFRSRSLLDRDQSVRGTSLGAIYTDAGLQEVGRRLGAQAVTDDYANASAHLFLADATSQLLDPNRFDLRYETVRQSELLVANLLAPPEAANLSQRVSQQELLQLFHPRPIGLNTFTEYRSSGDRLMAASAFGTVSGLSYALDTQFQWHQGPVSNDQLERKDITLSLKQAVSLRDELYVQVGAGQASMGDVARQYEPNDAKAGLRAQEEQLPTLHLGYHRAWSPFSHTLFLFSRLDDSLTLTDSDPQILFLRSSGAGLISLNPAPGFASRLTSDFSLYSTELQHLWQSHHHTWIIGGRLQGGEVASTDQLDRALTGPVSSQSLEESIHRKSAYLYHQWRPFESLSLIGGIAYDHLTFPQNTDFLPLSAGASSRSEFSPRAGVTWTPWKQGVIRGSYARSLGGMFFDNNIRLEPTQMAGFTQSYRSLLPESVAGLLPGAHFDTLGAAFDQTFSTGTYLGVSAEWLHSHGERSLGALGNSNPFLPAPDTVTSLAQRLQFRERTVSIYLLQLLGEDWSLGGRYRLSHAQLGETFPGLPTALPGKSALEKQEGALMQQATLSLIYQHPSGFFGQWETAWRHQDSDGYTPARATESFWQHALQLGYRFHRRRAEFRIGVLNLANQDYRLSPINYYTAPPRERTFVTSLRLNF